MSFSLILFLIGVLGFVLNRKNIILMLISIEIMLLSITFLILISSLSFDDILGQTFSIYIISIAGAESAIGLGILVAFYRFNTSLTIPRLSCKNTYSKNVNLFRSITKTRNYSTKINSNPSNIYSIDPWFITGLFDAESSFIVTILKNPRYKTGWNVQARVQIKMHTKDTVLIQSIHKFFGNIGYISVVNKASTIEFRVSTIKDLVDVIIPHFDKYPLLTKKHSDYLLFKQIVLLMLNKEHNTFEGIQKIVNIKASLNLGLSNELKKAFPEVIPVIKSLDNFIYNNLQPEWVAGFCTGESNFFIVAQKSKKGIYTSLRFSVSQNSKDISLLESFVKFFGGGSVTNYEKRVLCEFIITKIDLIVKHVIPFFDKYPILGSKQSNFLDFKSAAYIIKNKEHLNEKGLKEILELKRKITLLYQNKVTNNNSVIEGAKK